MSKSYRVTMRNAQFGKSNLIAYVEAHNELSAAIAAVCAHPGWLCDLSDVRMVDDPALDTASTAHIDRSGASVQMENGAVLHFTSGGDADSLRGAGDRRWWPINGARTLSHRKYLAAMATLEALGYTYEGGEHWQSAAGDIGKSIASVVLDTVSARAAEWEKVSVNGCHEEQVRATGRYEVLAIADTLRKTFARAGLL